MELRSGRKCAKIINHSSAHSSDTFMSQLPNEVFECILAHVPNEDLIFRCRFVCVLWRNVITSYCHRHRFIRLVVKYGFNNYSLCFRDAFPSANDTLWSSAVGKATDGEGCGRLSKYGIWLEIDGGGFLYDDEFLTEFGHRFRKLELSSKSYKFIMGVLEMCPNLESLVCNSTTYSAREQENFIPPAQVITLHKLRNLHLENYHPVDFQFLEYIISYPTILLENIHVSLKLKNEWEETLRKIITLTTGIRVTFGFEFGVNRFGFAEEQRSMDFLERLQSKKCKTRALKVKFQDPFRPEDQNSRYFKPFQNYLLSVSDSLEILSIYHYSQSLAESHRNSRLKIPFLPALRCFIFGDITSDIPDIILPLENNQFPWLKAFQLRSKRSETGSILSNCEFQSVNHFILRGDSYENSGWIFEVMDVNKLFPNLSRLDATVSAKQFRIILAKLLKLKHLTLNVYNLKNSWSTENTEAIDINVILSGYENPDASSRKSGSQRGPSLSSLKGLRVFSLDTDTCTLTEAGINLSLLQIQPLDRLTLRHLKLPVISWERLNSYHQIVRTRGCSSTEDPRGILPTYNHTNN